MRRPIGIYIHVPYCDQKCPYCDFYSVCDRSTADCYTNAVLEEMGRKTETELIADTLYLGGGTPPYLGTDNLIRLLEGARELFAFEGEATLEANPGSISLEMLSALSHAGYNRISFGVQSAADWELKALGRRHTAAEAAQAILWAKQAGFTNISADLMLGIPGQTVSSVRESIAFLTRLPLQHVSAYLLKIEERTPFAADGTISRCPSEEETCEIYLAAVEVLEKVGFHQYEISNFARDGFTCHHNLKYWRCEEYLGFGPAAHSYFDGKRYGHSRDLARYLTAPEETLFVTDEQPGDFEETAMLRLRLTEGLSLKDIQLLGAQPNAVLEKARPLERAGLLYCQNGRIALTPRGFLVSNAVIARLLY